MLLIRMLAGAVQLQGCCKAPAGKKQGFKQCILDLITSTASLVPGGHSYGQGILCEHC